MPNKKRIAFLCNYFPLVSETFIRLQIDYFVKKGYEVDIYPVHLLLDHPLLKNYKNVFGFSSDLARLVSFPYYFLRYFLFSPLALIRSLSVRRHGDSARNFKLFYISVFIIARGKYDILMCHFGNTGNIGAFIKKCIDPNIRLICMFHGVDIRAGIQEGGSIYSDLFAEANEILSISSYNQRHLERFGAPNIRHHAVGVDVAVCKKTDRVKLPGAPVHILTVARLVWEKGYKHAFDAVKLLKETYAQHPFVYHVIGDGPLRDELRQYVREKGLSDVVIFEGELFGEEVHKHYRDADLFLLPSIAEALPVVVMEAQAYEIPVVATDVGSVHEEIDDGRTGFLVPPGNSGEIAKKIDWLLRHREEWADMGKKGREKMKKEFNISRLNMELEDIFFEV